MQQVYVTIAKMKAIISEVENGEIQLIRILRDVAEIKRDQDLYLGLIERLLQVNPDDTDSRFSLAYKYGEVSQAELSVFHYLKIPEKERGPYAWNNLGVEFDNCDLPNKSIDAYRKAEEFKNTLAMSNLANRLIKAGFLKEAEEICNRAITHENYHKNVLESISSIKNIPEQEDKKEKPILDMVKPLSEFYRDYGYASLQINPADYLGKWQGPLCELQLTIKDNKLVATGSYEQAYLAGLAGGLWGGPALGYTPQPKRYNVKYEGEIFGRAIKGIFTEKAEEQPTSVTRATTLLTAIAGEEKKTDVLMILSESLHEIRVYEKDTKKDLKFYSLKRID